MTWEEYNEMFKELDAIYRFGVRHSHIVEKIQKITDRIRINISRDLIPEIIEEGNKK